MTRRECEKKAGKKLEAAEAGSWKQVLSLAIHNLRPASSPWDGFGLSSVCHQRQQPIPKPAGLCGALAWPSLIDCWVNHGVICCRCGQCLQLGPKFMPACVRGCAHRRPGIFYSFRFHFRATLYDFESTLVSSFVNWVTRLVWVVSKFAH